MKKTIISAKGLSKSFAHNGGQVHIISNADLDIYDGDFTIIMGASGSGKSTMLYALSGMDRATAGRVEIDGKNITEMNERELSELRHTKFGFVFQQIHLVSNLTLFENVAVPGYLDKSRQVSEINKYADELLEKMGIEKIKTQLPSQCSGGEQQRCAIARALINKPALVFADEPTAELDSQTSITVVNIFKKLVAEEGVTIVMTTHDTSLMSAGDAAFTIEDGRISGEVHA